MTHLPLSAESIVDKWIRFLLDEVSYQWLKFILLNSIILTTMELNNDKKQGPFYSD